MFHVVLVLVAGLIVGWLGRLLVPGPNPMGIITTILVGLAGAIMGGIIGNLLFEPAVALLCSVLGAAVIVWIIEQLRPSGGTGTAG